MNMEARDLLAILKWILQALTSKAAAAAIAYAYCKVCFQAWDVMLDAAGENILGYTRWPANLKRLLHAVYPAYFVYSSIKRLSGPEGPVQATDVNKWKALCTAACIVAGVQASSAGSAVRHSH